MSTVNTDGVQSADFLSSIIKLFVPLWLALRQHQKVIVFRQSENYVSAMIECQTQRTFQCMQSIKHELNHDAHVRHQQKFYGMCMSRHLDVICARVCSTVSAKGLQVTKCVIQCSLIQSQLLLLKSGFKNAVLNYQMIKWMTFLK